MASIITMTLVSVNYFGDAAKIFKTTFEREMVDILRSGQNVTNISDYNERIFQREMIGAMESTPELVVLGSSRAMFIGSHFFEGISFYNSAVNGAAIEDLLGIFEMYRSKEGAPVKFIIGVDPWMFNDNNGQTQWESLSKEYNSLASSIGIPDVDEPNTNNLRQLLSLSYFQSSLKNLPNLLRGEDKMIATDQSNNQANTELIDGMLVYGSSYGDVDEQTVLLRAKEYIQGKVYGLNRFLRLSSEKKLIFETWMNFLKDSGFEVSILLTPYHPLVFEHIRNEYPIVLEVESYVSQLAEKNGFLVFGSYNPNGLGITGNDFFDGMHATPDALFRILSNMESQLLQNTQTHN